VDLLFQPLLAVMGWPDHRWRVWNEACVWICCFSRCWQLWADLIIACVEA